MTKKCAEVGADEIFVGNCLRKNNRIAQMQAAGVSIRLGELAYDIDGQPLPNEYAPMLVKRSSADRYNDFMMTITFGSDWRRNQ